MEHKLRMDPLLKKQINSQRMLLMRKHDGSYVQSQIKS
jgi:hypothetical protein